MMGSKGLTAFLHRRVPIMLNNAHFRASFFIILQYFTSKISKNTECAVGSCCRSSVYL